MGVSLSQPPLTLRDRGLDEVLFLADFAGDLALDVADDALAAFDLGADDAKAIEGNASAAAAVAAAAGSCVGIVRSLARWIAAASDVSSTLM